MILLAIFIAYLVGIIPAARWTYRHGLPGDPYFARSQILAWGVGLTWPVMFIAIGSFMFSELILTWRSEPKKTKEEK